MTIMTPDHQVLDLASAASDERGAVRFAAGPVLQEKK